jgi:hypothetical protein
MRRATAPGKTPGNARFLREVKSRDLTHILTSAEHALVMSDAGVGSLVAFHAIGKWCATHQSAPRRSWCSASHAARIPAPHAGGRGDGQGDARYAPGRATRNARLVGRLRPSGSIPRRNRVTGVRAARRDSGEMAARRRAWVTGTGKSCATRRPAPRRSWTPARSVRRASPSARRRSRGRTTRGGRLDGPPALGRAKCQRPPRGSRSRSEVTPDRLFVRFLDWACVSRGKILSAAVPRE